MNNAAEWMRDLEYEDLPDQHKKLADIIGVEATVKLCEACGGMACYIPVTEGLYVAARHKAIRRDYNGQNVAKLARKYNLSVRAIQLIVQSTNPQIDGQLSLLDVIGETGA